MQWFFLAIILICILLLASGSFTRMDPKALARGIRIGGGLAALALAVLLFVIGRAAFAMPVAALGAMLLTRALGPVGTFRVPGGGSRSSGQTSRVRSEWLEMELDHDTGEMSGHFIKGPLAGEALGDLDRDRLIEAYDELRRRDPRGAQLLETYLDRRHEGWREAAEAAGTSTGGASAGPMGREEAYMVLGLAPGASDSDIRAAHRRLMKKLHPDQGGSTALAAKVNEAKDVLLGGRR